jgi:hypothetical protein
MSKNRIINKGTGAGGANTTYNGLSFEDKTSIENNLDKLKYIKKDIKINKRKGYYYEYIKDNINIIYFTKGCKNSFKLYFEKEFKITTYRQPDEAYLIKQDDKYILKILEKKNQNVEGSVEDKLKTGAFNRREYELMVNIHDKYNFTIEYSFCVSKFLQDKFELNQKVNNIKYKNIKKIMEEDKIGLLYGDDDNYIDKLCEWINKLDINN